MKKIIITQAFFIAFILLVGTTVFGQNKAENKPLKGFALLELYTSEGCSSCPPADDLMGKLQNELKNENVYVLSYHVDYWDKQGWKDIFSNADYTKRQYEYAKYLGKEPIYTPQVIVNGKSDYIASQETTVRNAIKSALSKPAVIDLTLNATQNNSDVTVKYTVEGNSKNSQLLIAIVQKAAKSNVKRGENARRILSHYQIVRKLQTINVKENKGTVSIHLPKDFNTTEFEVLGFVQDVKTGYVLGVNRADFSPAAL